MTAGLGKVKRRTGLNTMLKTKKLIPASLAKKVKRFGSEDACRVYLEELRWPFGVRCPRCGSDRISRIRTRRKFGCNACRYQFSVTVGTIFQNSHVPLWKWFIALYLMTESKEGVSVSQVKETLGVTYKTAQSICHRIQAAMRNDPAGLLRKISEPRLTWQGDRKKEAARGKRGGRAIHKGVRGQQSKARLRVARRANGKNPWLFRDTLRRLIFADRPPRRERVAS
jgi:transposase-like protein